jgi:hypothetical protein
MASTIDAFVPAWMLEMQKMEAAVEIKRNEKREAPKATKVTVWLGGLPCQLANDEAALHVLLGRFGQLEKTTIRVKSEPYKSWALATFLNLDAIEQLTKEPVAVEPEPGQPAPAQGAPAWVLTVKEANVQGELAKKQTVGTKGALATAASEHDAKIGARSSVCMPLRAAGWCPASSRVSTAWVS